MTTISDFMGLYGTCNRGIRWRQASKWAVTISTVPWRRKWQSTPVFLAGESHEQRSLASYSPWGCREWGMTERARIARWIDEIAEDIEAQLLGLTSHRGMESRLMSLQVLIRRQQYLFLCDIFFKRMCMKICHVGFCCYQPYSCRTIQVFEWLPIRKTALFILCWSRWSTGYDWTAFWFYYVLQRRHFWIWVYTLCHPQRNAG